MSIKAGRLRHRITIRRPVEISDGNGGFTTSWTTLATPMAEVIGLAGRERLVEQALQGIAVYRITIRWRGRIVASDQIVLADGTELNVRSAADPDGLRRELVILADSESVRGS